MSALILLLGLLTGHADYDHGTWSVDHLVVGHSPTEDSTITTIDGWTIILPD